MKRRGVLAGLAAGISLFAGCNTLNTDEDTNTNSTDSTTAMAATTTTISENESTGAEPTETESGSSSTATDMTTPVTEAPTTTETTATTDSGQLDLSPLTTYTNDIYGYQIDYPVSWLVDESVPREVEIVNFDRDVIRITVYEGRYASNTLEEITDLAIANTREAMTDFAVLERRKTMLESGQQAAVVYMRYDVPTDRAVSLRNYTLVTKQVETTYHVEFIAHASDWTPTVERTVRRIVGSFALTET